MLHLKNQYFEEVYLFESTYFTPNAKKKSKPLKNSQEKSLLAIQK